MLDALLRAGGLHVEIDRQHTNPSQGQEDAGHDKKSLEQLSHSARKVVGGV
jgi:hypothetical protein